MAIATRYAIGLDVGGTSARAGLIGDDGTVLFEDRSPTGITATGEELIERFRQGIRGALEVAADRRSPIAGIGLAMPAFVDEDGSVAGSCNLPGLNGVPVRDLLEREFAVPVRMENDVSAAACGEYYFGGHQQSSRRMLFLAIGTGIGAGMIVDGKLLRLAQGCLGDPGHIIVDPFGDSPCRCGGKGCLEAVASGWALVERARRRGIEATPGEIFRLASAGDPAHSEIAMEAATYVGIGLATLCVLLNPDTIVLGGGVAEEAGVSFLERAEEIMRLHAVPFLSRQARVVSAKTGSSAGMLGAAALTLFGGAGPPHATG